jgi:glycosyltransferase involved in cell wall biosynthesis
LPESINIIVVFAGEEKHFTREYFDTKIKEYKLINKVILRLGFIKDDDMQYYYSACDGVILPYRKNFLGQSGPLTFAAKYCKPVIASDVLELKHIVIKYHTGICFIAEDEDSLAEKIIEFHDNLKKYQNNKFKNNIRKYLSISSLQNSIKTYIRIIGMNNSL